MIELVRKRLLSDEVLRGILTHYGNEAVYYRKAPDDVTFEANYPQLILKVDKYTDARRGVSGQLEVEIICTNLTIPPEPLERLVRENLQGVIFNSSEIFMSKWSKTEVFEEPASERMPMVIGSLVTFSLYELPAPDTSEPDAITTFNDWATEYDEKILVIGAEEFEIFVPSREEPALYFDVERVRQKTQNNGVIWLEAVVKGHVFAPSVRSRREWISELHRGIMLKKALKMRDKSPLRVVGSEVTFGAEEIAGQMTFTCEYGLPKPREYGHILNKPKYEFGEELKYV